MKKLFLILMVALPTTAFAIDNPRKFEAYKERLAERRAFALETRRWYNAQKGPHIYRTAIAINAPITPYAVSEQRFVPQPPIPMRPYRFPSYPPYGYTVFPQNNVGMGISPSLTTR